MRVYELAREVRKKSKEVIELLSQWGIQVKNHMSMVDDRGEFLIREWIRDHEEKQEKKKVLTETLEPPPKEEEAKPPPSEPPKPEPVPIPEAPPPPEDKPKPAEVRVFEVENPVGVRTLIELLEQPVGSLMKDLIQMGVMATINQAVDLEIAKKLAEKYNVLLEEKPQAERNETVKEEVAGDLTPRPPVVAVLGHVDHGKTKLLDAIRKTNVAERERGGITQHMGASQVTWNGRHIIFLDTPGHEAFTALRARGAQVTDLVVLVVAADDGVMPQTLEAVSHARAAHVPILVAINKMDKDEANPEQVKRQLSEQELIPEDWGGETIVVPCSAKTGKGIQDLLEMILLQAELLDLKARATGPAQGTVIESRMDRSRGILCTLLIQHGTLEVGNTLIVGSAWGKVRNMWNDRGEIVRTASPNQPVVEVMGIGSLPQAGDPFQVLASEKEAREMARQRQEAKQAVEKSRKMTLEKVTDLMAQKTIQEITLIGKGDTQGSLEGLLHALSRLSSEEVQLRILHSGIGDITESDVLLASASSAVILGFCVKCSAAVLKAAEREGVQVRLYHVIYDAVEEIKQSIAGMLKEKFEEIPLGSAQVKAVFPAPKLKQVAGCIITEGVVQRGAKFRIRRGEETLGPFSLDSLRRFKEDVREVGKGLECGIGSFDIKDFAVGDILDVVMERKV